MQSPIKRLHQNNRLIKPLLILVSWILFGVIPIGAQPPTTTQARPNIAVIPFVGDRSVSAEQLNFLTGKFAAELMATKSFRILDRSKMDYILQEQGFQQSGVCHSSECQIQMGQLLGVDAIVAGNLVRFGSKYAFRADYIDVALGQVLYTSEVDESGDLEDVYAPLCKNAAQALAENIQGSSQSTAIPVGVLAPETQKTFNEPPEYSLPAVNDTGIRKPLSLKRKIALALWGTGVASAGSCYYFDTQMTH